jgi:Flp pilus assembly protein TadD
LNLGVIYQQLGQYDKAVVETKEALRLVPRAATYGNLAFEYIAIDKLNDAEKLLRQAQGEGFDGIDIRGNLYLLASGKVTLKGWSNNSPGRRGASETKM